MVQSKLKRGGNKVWETNEMVTHNIAKYFVRTVIEPGAAG